MNYEIWKDIKGYEGEYQVSNKGNVRSLDRICKRIDRYGNETEYKYKGKILSKNDNGNGYLTVKIKRNGKRFYVHRLVAEAFLENKENLKEVNHKDNNRSNNVIDNLEWVSRQQNIEHCLKQGRNARGERNKKSKLKEEDVLKIREMIEEGFLTQREIGEKFGVQQPIISSISLRKKWKHI